MSVTFERTWQMADGPYAFGERVEARLRGSGNALHLWVGITSISGHTNGERCLGTLPSRFLAQLATEIQRRLKPQPQPPAASTTDHRLAKSARRGKPWR